MPLKRRAAAQEAEPPKGCGRIVTGRGGTTSGAARMPPFPSGPKLGPKLLRTPYNWTDAERRQEAEKLNDLDRSARAITRLSALQNRCSTAELSRLRFACLAAKAGTINVRLERFRAKACPLIGCGVDTGSRE